jgi:hypothetical protein
MVWISQSIWNPYGMVWTSPDGIHGIVHGFHMDWDFIKKFTKSNIESMVIPWTGFNGSHLDSLWNRYLGLAKINLI